MGKRSTARRLAMQALYQAEIAGRSIDEALNNLFAAEKFIPEAEEFAESLARAAWAEREKNDKVIASLSIDWSLGRLGKVDHAILRLALYELNSAATPPAVVINEALELAKKYSGQEAAKFINGILGSFLRQQ